MRRAPKLAAAVSVGAMVALAGCGSANKPVTSSPTTQAPAATAPATTVPAAGVLSPIEQSDLRLIHEQERAGLDAYAMLASRYRGQPVFANLANSQRAQLAALTAMMARYGLGDPSAGMAAGRYSDPVVQQLYDSTVAGGTSADHALDAAEHFEEHNLASLQAVHGHTTRSDLMTMYSSLQRASDLHIAACTAAHQHPGSQG